MKSDHNQFFDSDSSSVVCDNSANVHICNNREMFVGEISPYDKMKVATIDGKGHSASGIGTVRWKWSDDNGKVHDIMVDNVLFFPQSPINILSVTSFAQQLNDPEGTGITTVQNNSRLFWDHGKFSRTIRHPASNLPEMPLNEGFSLLRMHQVLVSKVINTIINSHFNCHLTSLNCDNECKCLNAQNNCNCCKHVHTAENVELKTELFEV